MKKLLWSILIVIPFVSSYDGHAQNLKMNRISLESGSAIGGLVGIAYERRLVKKLAVFGGVSILKNPNDVPFGYAFGVRLIPKDNDGGFITSLSFGTGISSVGSEQAGYDYAKGITLLVGYRFVIKQIIDIDLGIGAEYITEKPSDGFITVTNDWIFAANLGIGYHF